MAIYVGGTGSANQLDDYEEGTWTPGVNSGASSISVSTANYTKVGRAVTVQIRYNSVSGLTGSVLQITGLPFASMNSIHFVAPVMHDGWDYSGSEEPYPTVYHSGGNTHFVFYYSRTNGNTWASVNGNQTNGQGAITSWTYFAA